MWWQLIRIRKDCEHVRDALERSTNPGAESVVALGTLLAGLPESMRLHVNACSECRVFADELVEVRGMFRGEPAGPQPGPYFLSRVMASIAARERKLEKSSQTWAAVPRLAYRLSVLACLTILIAGSWLYERPSPTTSVASISAEQSPEGLVEGSVPIQDDFLLNTADR
jgi:hypothetical protein